jgi:hypothetical protein
MRIWLQIWHGERVLGVRGRYRSHAGFSSKKKVSDESSQGERLIERVTTSMEEAVKRAVRMEIILGQSLGRGRTSTVITTGDAVVLCTKISIIK